MVTKVRDARPCVHQAPCNCLCGAVCCLYSPRDRCVLEESVSKAPKAPNGRPKGSQNLDTWSRYREISIACKTMPAEEVAQMFGVCIRTVKRATRVYPT